MALYLSKVIRIQKLSSRPLLLRYMLQGKGREKEGTHIRVREDRIERHLHVVKSGA